MAVVEIYFAFLKRFSSYILAMWLIAFGVCLVYGPPFLSQTRSDFKLPESLPSTLNHLGRPILWSITLN